MTDDPHNELATCQLDYSTTCDPGLQEQLLAIDRNLREPLFIDENSRAVGLLDLTTCRLALIRPDVQFYGASVPKIGILLAYFSVHPEAATTLEPNTRHELGLMIKASSNELAAKYSQQLGLGVIRDVLDRYHFYDASRGGGIWVGKHYGIVGERIGDPLNDHSHAVTVRQGLRFGLLLEQGRLVSPRASRTMREIFAAPEIPHAQDRFVKGLQNRSLEVLRKSGWWEDWFHDLAIVRGEGRHYILVGLTHHPKGDDYLAPLARAVDDLIAHEGLKTQQ